MKRMISLLTFVMTSLAVYPQAFSGDMENWRQITTPLDTAALQSPNGWNNTDSIVFMAKYLFPMQQFNKQTYRDGGSHSGNFAVKLITRPQGPLGVLPGMLTNTQPYVPAGSLSPVFYGGSTVSDRIETVTAWVKYFPKGGDSAVIHLKALLAGAATGGGDSIIGDTRVFITHMDSIYTFLTIPVMYYNDTSMPDLFQIFISSSDKNPHDSSTLFVDDVSINYSKTRVVNTAQHQLSCFPNPAKDHLNIVCSDNSLECVSIFNTSGRAMGHYKLVQSNNTIDISNLPVGVYYIKILGNEGCIIKKFEKIDI